jgi:hypothetical protein
MHVHLCNRILPGVRAGLKTTFWDAFYLSGLLESFIRQFWFYGLAGPCVCLYFFLPAN